MCRNGWAMCFPPTIHPLLNVRVLGYKPGILQEALKIGLDPVRLTRTTQDGISSKTCSTRIQMFS